MKQMKPNEMDLDIDEFNQKVSPDDFENGDFGTLDLGMAGEEGDYVNFMAQGVVTADGVQVKNVAILGGGSSMMDQTAEDEGPMSPMKMKGRAMMDKITQGEDDDE